MGGRLLDRRHYDQSAAVFPPAAPVCGESIEVATITTD
jgi:hypothetical protein